ncbi:hypothetical protein DY000_02023127 [Brassica cretica]|uniref:Serine-threonine/tyrosine-protein kinase catalytic domain-containing protein n=1 Tax=Brassica cretica TaxID=69181 RepID=A0ABQ7EHD1_BRACR|nr:hypothetical protein DY000_02023127 [Brassica cretica]
MLLPNSSTLVGAVETDSHLTPGHQAHKITTNSALTTPLEVPAPTTFTHSYEVQSTSCSKIENKLSMLAVEETAHPQSHVMEEIPSKEIILETPQASGNEQSIGHYSPIANNLQQFHMERDFPPLTHGRDDGLGEGVLSLSICCSLFQTYGDLSFNNLTGDVHGGRAPEYTSLTGNRLSGEVESGVFLKSNAHIDLSYNYFSWWPSCQENSNINAYQSSYLNNLNELLPCAGPTNYTSCNGYMAPEYALWGHLTEKADVFSFGVVAMEIVSGKSNMKRKGSDDHVSLINWALTLHQRGDIMEIVDPVLQGDFNSKEAVRMIKVAFLCTNSSPSLRPTMSEAVKMLEGEINIREVMSDPGLYGHNWSISNLINIDTHGSSSVSGVAHQTATTMQSSVSGSDLYPFCNESMILNSTAEFSSSPI